MGDEIHHEIHDMVIENHELTAHGREHHEGLEARLAECERRLTELEGREHQHSEEEFEEVVEEV